MSIAKTYVQVILPVRFRDTVTYSVPEELVPYVKVGSRVEVMLGYRKYKGFVEEVTQVPRYDTNKIKNILGIDTEISATPEDIKLWRTISAYYMCSSGEALKAATPFLMEIITKREKKSGTKMAGSVPEHHVENQSGTKMAGSVPEHSDKLDEIAELFTKGKTVLLHTGSQQEAYPIYARLAAGQMEKGKDTLILTPDIPSCRTMEKFLAPHFDGRLIAYHSGQSTAKRREATRSLLNGHISQHNPETDLSSPGHIIIGLRSALFLPMKNLGLIIVDQEHSPLYKQSEPTPRYHGRDTALILAQIHKANILLGSSTPSFESLANTRSGKYSEVILSDTTSGSRLRIIDFSKEHRTGSTKGPLTNIALATLRESASKGIKCAIYRPKWAYPQLEEEWLPELEQALGGIKAEIFTQIHQIEALKTKPSLIILLQGESLLSPKNFRAEERALQQIHTLTELAGMGKHPGSVIIQTSLFKHNVFRHLCAKVELDTLLHERSELNLPPYSRLIQITVREESPEKTEAKASEIANIIKACGASDFDGPIPVCPTEYIFQIKLPKSSSATSVKRSITAALYRFEDIIIDVDPQ